jgi:hypothetical protein
LNIIGNKKAAFGIAGALAALLLTAGTAVGVQGYNDETSHRCADAVTAVGQSAAAATAAQDKASTAKALAGDAAGFAKADGSAPLLSGVDAAASDLGALPEVDCSTREQATTLVATTGAVASKAATLSEAAGKLSDHVEAFRAAETKRIAAEKKEADEAAAAKQAEEAAAAAEAPARAAAQVPAAPAQLAPAPLPAGVAPAPVRQAPLPAPAAPLPAPAPAPVRPPTGGWTPPPPGSGPGGPSCTQIGDYVMCTK